MMNLIIFLIFIAASAVLGVSIAQDPGMLLIAYQHTTVEMPLWLGVILAFMAVFLLYTAIRLILALIYAPTHAKEWFMQNSLRRARRRTVAGFIALAEGHWAKAEKLFVSSSHQKHTALINYLCAATAAEKLGETTKRDEYLRQAHSYDGRAELAIGITAARLQMDSGQWEQSLATLTRLHSIAPEHDYVLELMYQVLLQLKDWSRLLDVLPTLRKRKIMDEKTYHDVSKRCYQGLYHAVSSAHDKKHVWQRIPTQWRLDADIVLMYLPLLIAEQDLNTAENLMKMSLNHEWDERLVRYYGRVHCEDLDKQIKTVEQWQKKHKDDAALMLTLSQLYCMKGIWGQAKEMALASLHISPNAEGHYVLGRIEENLGDKMAALNHFESGLRLSLAE